MGGVFSKASQKTPEQIEREEKEQYTREFLRNPRQFVGRHCIEASMSRMGVNGHTGGQRQFQITSFNGFALSLCEPFAGATQIIEAYFLRSSYLNGNEQTLAGNCNYMFTPVFSGCIFIAWREVGGVIKVDHLNPNSGANVAQVVGLLQNINLNAQEILYVLSPTFGSLANIVAPHNITQNITQTDTYDHRANVFGVRAPGTGWQFFSRTFN